jgi:putative toxin-antitoxin system antitoxin component (TIGR02293 family)
MTLNAVFKPAQLAQSAAARALLSVGRILDVKPLKLADIARITREGIDPSAVDALVQRGFAANELSWIVKPRTLSHRRQKRERLSSEETGRWFRAARIQALALEVFANPDKASRWLHASRQAFDGLTAMEMMQTEAGAQIVEETLNQLDAGYFA